MAEKTYIFPVILELDEEGWRIFSPSLESMGASTWGETQEEVLKNMREALAVMLEEFLEEGKDVPRKASLPLKVLSSRSPDESH